MTSHGTIVWNELNTWDPEKAKAYCAAVMGWTYDEAPTADTDQPRPYYIAKKDGRPVAGIFTLTRPHFEGIPDHWFAYLAVDDLAAAIAQCTAAGGKVCREPFDIPGFGRVAVVSDINGAVMAIMQPAEAPRGS